MKDYKYYITAIGKPETKMVKRKPKGKFLKLRFKKLFKTIRIDI